MLSSWDLYNEENVSPFFGDTTSTNIDRLWLNNNFFWSILILKLTMPCHKAILPFIMQVVNRCKHIGKTFGLIDC